MSEPVTAKEFFQGFPEAPISDTFKWIDADGFEHMFTMRGYAASAVLKALAETRDAIKTQGGTFITAKQQPAQSQPAPAGATPEKHDTSLNTLEVVKMEVTPKPDNKVELKLYGEGHKYPDLYHNGTVDQVLLALQNTGAAWTAENLRVASSFDVNFYADWRNSEKLNQNGKPYQNIQGYRATPF